MVVPSLLAVATVRPSGEKSAWCTHPWCRGGFWHLWEFLLQVGEPLLEVAASAERVEVRVLLDVLDVFEARLDGLSAGPVSALS